MSNHAFSRITLEDWPAAQLPLSEGNAPTLLADVRSKLPQFSSDNLQSKSIEPSSEHNLHYIIYPKAASFIKEDFASEICSDSRDSGYCSINRGSSAS